MSTYMYVRDVRRVGLARRLARRLNIRCVDADHQPVYNETPAGLICWGNSTPPSWQCNRRHFWLANDPEHIRVAGHKLRALDALSSRAISTLEYTRHMNIAEDWLDGGDSVYARTVLQGHSGEGLVFLNHCLERSQRVIPQAPLYTKDFGTPFKEYRVHVAFGEVIDITQKRRMSEETLRERNMQVPEHRERLQVRVHDNGWVFARQNIQDHADIRALAVQACGAINNMAMAAVDIVAEWHGGRPTRLAVMEINTAPALRSDTLLNHYVQALQPIINNNRPVEF